MYILRRNWMCKTVQKQFQCRANTRVSRSFSTPAQHTFDMIGSAFRRVVYTSSITHECSTGGIGLKYALRRCSPPTPSFSACTSGSKAFVLPSACRHDKHDHFVIVFGSAFALCAVYYEHHTGSDQLLLNVCVGCLHSH